MLALSDLKFKVRVRHLSMKKLYRHVLNWSSDLYGENVSILKFAKLQATCHIARGRAGWLSLGAHLAEGGLSHALPKLM